MELHSAHVQTTADSSSPRLNSPSMPAQAGLLSTCTPSGHITLSRSHTHSHSLSHTHTHTQMYRQLAFEPLFFISRRACNLRQTILFSVNLICDFYSSPPPELALSFL